MRRSGRQQPRHLHRLQLRWTCWRLNARGLQRAGYPGQSLDAAHLYLANHGARGGLRLGQIGRLRQTTPTSGVFTGMPSGGLQPNSGAPSNRKSTENTTSFESKPISARFGRKETGRLQRPKIGACSVSVVWSTSLNPFEYKRISGTQSTPMRVGDEVMAEDRNLGSNGLLGGRGATQA